MFPYSKVFGPPFPTFGLNMGSPFLVQLREHTDQKTPNTNIFYQAIYWRNLKNEKITFWFQNRYYSQNFPVGKSVYILPVDYLIVHRKENEIWKNRSNP